MNKTITTTISTVHMEIIGEYSRNSHVVQELTTGKYFASSTVAASYFGLSQPSISWQLCGRGSSTKNGLRFVRVSPETVGLIERQTNRAFTPEVKAKESGKTQKRRERLEKELKSLKAAVAYLKHKHANTAKELERVEALLKKNEEQIILVQNELLSLK